jgi:thiol:disulfide interchange protein DsbD
MFRFVRFSLSFAAALTLAAQEEPRKTPDPIQWSLEVESGAAAPGGKVLAKLQAAIEPGWHLYSTTTPPGPIPTRIGLAENPNAKLARLFQQKPARSFDPVQGSEQESYERQATFLLEIEIAAGAPPGELELVAETRYQACSDKVCLRLKRKGASAKLRIDPGAGTAAPAIPAGFEPARIADRPAAAAPETPVVVTKSAGEPLGAFLIAAFGWGLAAVITPCVFPMIPMTMSVFLRHEKGAALHGLVFSIGIVVFFTAIGLAVTAILGPFGANQLGSNPWVNGVIALVFFALGLSMLGAFELTLPSGMLTRMHEASSSGGAAGTLLLGLTFALTSFACVGPFVGTLLAASVQGEKLRPLAGMATFAAGLSFPFFLLSLFPSYLKKLPRSGSWLPRVKTVMGFIILAWMFYYLSNVDRVTHTDLLTRERFLAIWVVLFAMPGLYLLGFLRMEGADSGEHLGVGRVLAGVAFLAFSASLIPGMFGTPLGDLEPYVPAPSAQTAAASQSGLEWMKDDYKGALAKAKQSGKRVFVSFTGYACTNCKWMKRNMLPKPEIAAVLQNMVLVELYTDGTDAASVENQKLQESRFHNTAIPQYAIVDSDGALKASFVGLERNPQKFLQFLNSAQ